jgi:hypothetical protein
MGSAFLGPYSHVLQPGEHMSAAAEGERSAIRGYRWQYDQLAARVYDALLDDTFLSLRLTDPNAGKVDDLVLVTDGGTTGHQYKSEGDPGALTLTQLLAARQTRGGNPAPSHMRALADGWVALRNASGFTQVEFVTNKRGSTNDRLGTADDPQRPEHDSFAAFLDDVLNPIRIGNLHLTDVPAGWHHALKRVQNNTELNDADFADFLQALHIRVHQPDPLQTPNLSRRADVQELSEHLFRLVSNADALVELDRTEILTSTGWLQRTAPLNEHRFEVELDTYEPLQSAIDALQDQLDGTAGGYVALLGPPGSGKSTLLSQALTHDTDRVLRYYAYIPRSRAGRNRLEANAFLHDVVLMLQGATNTSRTHLLDTDTPALRQQLDNLLQRAATQHAETGLRTIIVIDGLDHVERDHRGLGSLLDELPDPDRIGDGVIVVIGSRTDSPVSGAIRAQLTAGRTVDLAEHRLGHDATLTICQRAPQTAGLDPAVHEQIANLAAGHPLSLAYLLNKVATLEPDADITTELEQLTTYDGDIAATYESIWAATGNDEQDLLALVTRLRIPFTRQDLADWFGTGRSARFRPQLGYLFRFNGTTWSVFHDSFRQFVIVQTNTNDTDNPDDPMWDVTHHAELADRCTQATRADLRWEELYHRHRAGQDITALISQEAFREQTIALRSTGAIREDLNIVLRHAAARRDLLTFTTAALAKIEFEGRLNALEQVDMTGTYVQAGLLVEAVAFSGIDQVRQIPLGQAYDLAARLGEAGSPQGQRLFAAVESSRFGDDDRIPVAGRNDDIHEAWATAATRYRPIRHVVNVLRTSWPPPDADDHGNFPGFRLDRPALIRFQAMAQQVCKTLRDTGRLDDLDVLDALLDELWTTVDAQQNDDSSDAAKDEVDDQGDENDGADSEDDDHDRDESRRRDARRQYAMDRDATLTDIALTIAELRADAVGDETEANRMLADAVELTRHAMFDINMYHWAHIAIDIGDLERAEELLLRRPLDTELTRSNLGYTASVPLHTRFDYWRARHRLHRRQHPDRGGEILESITPRDHGESRDQDDAADELTHQIDRAVRVLAAAAAASDEGSRYDLGHLTTAIIPTLSYGRHLGHGSATYEGIRQTSKTLLALVIDVAADHSPTALEQLADRFGVRFDADSADWSLAHRLQLAARFARHGCLPAWYGPTLTAQEAALPHGDLDITSRLETIAELVVHHQRLGQRGEAQRLARTLLPTSFGVGYRKDDQFKRWIEFFAAAVTAGLPNAIEQSTKLGRLLRVAGPMTEGAPRQAAASMLRALGTHHPGHAVALFEYLVRHGAVDHVEGLAELVTGLVDATDDEASIVLCVDLVTDLICTTDRIAHPDVAKAVAHACRRLPAARRDELLGTMQARFDCNPLATTRWKWLDAIGIDVDLPPEDEGTGGDDWGHLRLDDGRSLTKAEASAAVAHADDVIELRRHELPESSFDWVPILEHLGLTVDDLSELTGLFEATPQRDASALVLLGRRWLVHGQRERALECANLALEVAGEDAWARWWGTTRRDAHEIAIAAGGDTEFQRAWDDLAACIGDRPWRAELMLNAIDEIGAMLGGAIPPIDLWALIRVHLDGMTLGVTFDTEEPLTNQPIRWWLNAATLHVPRVDTASTAEQAIAAIVVDHATHPALVVREPAIAIGATNASSGGHVLTVVDQVLQATLPDDIVEALSRIVFFVDPNSSPVAAALHQVLGASDNAYVRQLSATPDSRRRPLPARYRLALPPARTDGVLLGVGFEFTPYERDIVERIAELVDLPEDNLLGHVHAAIAQIENTYPEQRDVREALHGADMHVRWSIPAMFLKRAALGRLIRDAEAAGLLDDISASDRRLFNGFDPQLVHLRPGGRPWLMPRRPPASVRIELQEWLDGTDERVAEHLEAIYATDGLLIGAYAESTVLNWGWLQEVFSVNTLVGDAPSPLREAHASPRQVYDCQLRDLSSPAPASSLVDEQPLTIRNIALMFGQTNAFWTSFSPAVAAALDWTPVEDRPGTWINAEGEETVRTIWWVDGRPGHSGRAFNDSEADGTMVWATPAGTSRLRELGKLTRVVHLHRGSHNTTSGTTTNQRTAIVAESTGAQ